MFSENSPSYESVLHDDYIDDHKNTGQPTGTHSRLFKWIIFILDNSWISAKAIAFELNFEADFDTSENVTSENDTKCALNGSNKGVASWITISG